MLALLLVVCQVSGLFAASNCSFGDTVCWKKYFNDITPEITQGLPQLGYEKLDPMRLENVEIKTKDMNFTSDKNTVSGFKNTFVEDIRVYQDFNLMAISLNVNLTYEGVYNINGILFTIPVTGNGPFKVDYYKCRIQVVMSYDIIKLGNGKIRKNFLNFWHDFEVMEVKYNIENLLPLQTEMAGKVHDVLNENWKSLKENPFNLKSLLIANKIFYVVKTLVEYEDVK